MILDFFKNLLAMTARKRQAERVHKESPVSLQFGSGVTRDLSATGVYFESDMEYALDSLIHFEIELDTPGGKSRLECSGTVVRVEREGDRVGIAVKMKSQLVK